MVMIRPPAVEIKPGIFAVRPNEILELIVVDGESREAIFQPTMDDLEKMCDKYGFDLDYTMALIGNMDPNTHTVMFVVEKYREHLREVLGE